MSWYSASRSRYPPSLKINYPQWAVVRFLAEPRMVQVKDEDRWCVDVEYVEGTALSSVGPAEKGKTYTLWIGKTLAIALSRAFADPSNPDEVPKLKNKMAKIARGETKIRNNRVYTAEKVSGPLLKAAAPKVVPKEDISSYVESFKDVFTILREITIDEMNRWFDNKFAKHPPVNEIIREMVKQGIAEFDGEKVRAI